MAFSVIFLGIILFILIGASVASVVLFILDGIRAKRECTKRKTVFTVLFIVSMAILGTILVLYVAISILSVLIVMNM